MCTKTEKCLKHILKKVEIAATASIILLDIGIADEKEIIITMIKELNSSIGELIKKQ